MPSHISKQDIKEMFLIYKRNYKGLDDFETYKMRLAFFFQLTMKPFVFGDLSLPPNVSNMVSNDYVEDDRLSWKSRQHALQYWADTAQVKPIEVSKYFRSVDDFQPYT